MAMHAAGNRCDFDIHQGGAHGYLMRTLPLYEDTLKKTDAFLASLHLLPVSK